jgi:hypothetical protein
MPGTARMSTPIVAASGTRLMPAPPSNVSDVHRRLAHHGVRLGAERERFESRNRARDDRRAPFGVLVVLALCSPLFEECAGALRALAHTPGWVHGSNCSSERDSAVAEMGG